MKLLFCATDSGGCRNIAPLLPIARKKAIDTVLITQRNQLSLFYETGDLGCVIEDKYTKADLSRLLKEIRPQAIICGTTRYQSPERLLTSMGREYGIRTIAVLDEWYNYAYRFTNQDTGKMEYLPDVVAVQDRVAKTEAIAEGIPGSACRITGSPALSGLTKIARSFCKSPPDKPRFLSGNAGYPVITFLSETHAADYGTSLYSSGPMGPFIGYTEYTVREAILKLLQSLKTPSLLIEKLHPASADEELDHGWNGNVYWRSIKKAHLWTLMLHSDLIIGMRSMALLEASILGCTAVSFQPDLIGRNQCAAGRLNVVDEVFTIDELGTWVLDKLQGREQDRARKGRTFPFARSDAAERIVDLALQSGPRRSLDNG